MIEPFRIRVGDDVLDDLRERLTRTRLPDEADDAGWDYGTNRAFLGELIARWREGFDWRAEEARLNEHPQFRTVVDGDPIHFVHVSGAGSGRMPLVLTHGWPSTFIELLPLVPLLRDDFDLVIPSLPGFGFSTPLTRHGPRRVHDRWAALMRRLGYERFGACGSDIGARVTSNLGRYHADRVVAIHLSSVDLEWPDPLPADLTPEERDYIARCEQWKRDEGGYAAIQSTRPQTLAYGLHDSPAGLAAWIVEKFRAWSDCGGDVTSRFSLDDLLTTATVYWATGTINSANRSYYEARKHPDPLPAGQRIQAPAGIAMFPGEAQLVVPRRFAERCYHVEHWTDMPRGGHFAALEEPQLLADDIRAFFHDRW